MTFHDLLARLLRIWHWSALAAIASLVVPIEVGMRLGTGIISRLEGLHDHENHFADPFRWAEWLLFTSPYPCLLCAVIAMAAGITYLIGKKLPD
jgi:hypothetical protein